MGTAVMTAPIYFGHSGKRRILKTLQARTLLCRGQEGFLKMILGRNLIKHTVRDRLDPCQRDVGNLRAVVNTCRQYGNSVPCPGKREGYHHIFTVIDGFRREMTPDPMLNSSYFGGSLIGITDNNVFRKKLLLFDDTSCREWMPEGHGTAYGDSGKLLIADSVTNGDIIFKAKQDIHFPVEEKVQNGAGGNNTEKRMNARLFFMVLR